MTIDSKQVLAKKIDALKPWFHNMWLGEIRTAPDHFLGDYPEVKYRHFRDSIPADLTGLTVLDIGCNAGFYSMEMKKRGAERVIGIDTEERYLEQARFAAEVNGLHIIYKRMTVWEIADLKEKFDIVFFMGVFYHLRHPLLALDLIHEHVVKDLFIFQSMQRGSSEIASLADDYKITEPAPFELPGYPAMYFIEKSYSQDPTNWWVPNRAAVEAMLRSSGFSITAQPEDEVYICRRVELQQIENNHQAVYPSGTSH